MRVRLPRIEDSDLSLFQFDYDLTLMVFFLNGQEQIYGRYGGRDGNDADSRQSLAGLRYAMQAALDAHEQGEVSSKLQQRDAPKYIDEFASVGGGGCIHGHDAKEIMIQDMIASDSWNRELVWRYPLPDNLGLVLEVDRGDVVERVEPDSPASRADLKTGDVIESIAGLPVHSFADAQFALDGAPPNGMLDVRWQRGDRTHSGQLELPAGWRKTDITWRASAFALIPSSPLHGRDLTGDERRQHGLSEKQLAFVQQTPISTAVRKIGIRERDVILGFNGNTLEMEAYDFVSYVREHFLAGDQVLVDVIRNEQRLQLPMTLRGQTR